MINYYKIEVTRTNKQYPKRNKKEIVTVRHKNNQRACAIAKRYMVETDGIVGDCYIAEILEIVEV